jgi:hypothetical protein
MTTLAVDGGDAFALARLMLDADDARASADAQELRAARETQRQELDEQVQELHAAASDMREGAWIEGGMACAGGAMSILGTAAEPIRSTGASQTGAALSSSEKWSKVAIEGGQALSRLAGPSGALTFGASEKDAEARAKQHEALAADAAGRADEAARHRDRALDDADRTLATVQNVLQDEAAGRLALIANA